MNETNWTYADSISDKIIDMIRGEIRKPDFSPVQMLAGLMLGTMGYMKSAPSTAPPEFAEVYDTMAQCLRSMQAVPSPPGKDMGD